MEYAYLPVSGLNVTVPDAFICSAFRADFTKMVTKCGISGQKNMERSTPGDGYLIPFAFNLMHRALTDDVLFSRLKQASTSIQHWFFNDFFILPTEVDRLLFTESPVLKTKSVSEDFLELLKSIGNEQLSDLQQQVIYGDTLGTPADWVIQRENLVAQIRELQRTDMQLSQIIRQPQ